MVGYIEILTLGWEIIRDLAVVAWVVAPFIATWVLRVRNPWSRAAQRKLTPGLRGARDLQRLIRILGEAQLWLSVEESKLFRDVQRDLWTALMKLSKESLSYLAVNSADVEERCTAIRQLSQVAGEGPRSMIEGIIHNPSTSDPVLGVAQAALIQMNQRLKTRNQ